MLFWSFLVLAIFSVLVQFVCVFFILPSSNIHEEHHSHTPEPQIVEDYARGDLHNQSTAVLPLSIWEKESIIGNTNADSSVLSCNPPSHVSKQCCIGSFSMGGDIDYRLRYNCNTTTLDDYIKLQDHAEALLSSENSNLGCDVCRIIQLSLQDNLTIAFFGDSMQNQVVQGLICELQRRNYRVEVTRIPGKQDTCKRCIKWTQILRVTSPEDPTGSAVTIKFFFQYRYPFFYPDEEVKVATEADILIINLGLHWSWNGRMFATGRMHYRKSMNEFLRFLRDNGTQKLLLHRETSAQHFDADGGDWGLRNENSSKSCVPIRDYTSKAAAWREEKVAMAAKAQGFQKRIATDHNEGRPQAVQDNNNNELTILSWWNFTAHHHEMHPKGECSHYCSSPFLYLPLWRSLRMAMERQFANDKL